MDKVNYDYEIEKHYHPENFEPTRDEEDDMTQAQDYLKAKKEEIKKDYLDGMTLKQICEKHGIKKPETVCYHLRPLTPEERALHIRNKYLKKEVNK